jgi:tetratricopeptide (TPR) repeat protein
MFGMCQRFVLILFCVGCLVLTSPTCSAQATTDTADETPALKKRSGKKKVNKDKQAETRNYVSFRDARSAGYELKNADKLEASRDAYEVALTFESTDREKCEVYRSLVSIYPKLDNWDAMYEATEHIVENAPYPAFSSLTVRAMVSIVYRKKMQNKMFKRYEAKLEVNPKDRTSLTILESAVQRLMHDMPRQAEYLRRLIKLDKEEGKTPDSEMRAKLAFTLRLSHKEVESAEMYQSISDSDKDYRSYCLAQAAESWERAGQPQKAIAAAIEASNLGPDVRTNRSLYQWHRLLGDLFLKHLAKAPALKHYAAALENASIDPYRDQCREKLKLVEALKD